MVPTAYNDRPLISAWLISKTLIWTPTTYYRTKKTSRCSGNNCWMNELVELGRTDLKEKISWGKVNCLSKAISVEEWRTYSAFFFFANVSKNHHFRESILWCKTLGEGVSSWHLKMIHIWELCWEQCFEYFLRDFFPERKQLMEMEFYCCQEKCDKDQISYNYYQNRNFHRAKRFQSPTQWLICI